MDPVSEAALGIVAKHMVLKSQIQDTSRFEDDTMVSPKYLSSRIILWWLSQCNQ